MATPAEILASSVQESLQASYYKTKFLPQNKVLGPLVDSYLKGTGRRPSDAEIDQNHYAKGLVLAEDARRALGATTSAVYPSKTLYPSEAMP